MINEVVEGVARDWFDDFVDTRIARARRFGVTNRLADSIKEQILSDASKGVVLLRMLYADYGRFIDMKKLYMANGGKALIESLEVWATKKNLATSSQEANRIAWAIVKSKRKKRRAWFSSGKAKSFDDLFNEIAASLLDVSADQLAQKFKQK